MQSNSLALVTPPTTCGYPGGRCISCTHQNGSWYWHNHKLHHQFFHNAVGLVVGNHFVRVAVVLWHCAYCPCSSTQVADLIDKNREEVWEQFKKFAPQLDQLQQKGESIADAPVDDKTKSSTYWEKVGSNLLELARKCNSHHQVRLRCSLCLITDTQNHLQSLFSTINK